MDLWDERSFIGCAALSAATARFPIAWHLPRRKLRPTTSIGGDVLNHHTAKPS